MRALSATARRAGVRLLVVLAGIALVGVGLTRIVHAQGGDAGQSDYSGYCAASQDPAACQQLLNSVISKGLVPQGHGGEIPGIGGLGGLGIPGGAPINGVVQGPPPSVTVTPQPPRSILQTESSQLEAIYSQRASAPLKQFGYDLIGNGGTISALQIGAIQDDYILGQGDAIIVTLRGQENATYNVFVDRDGNVTLPRLRPVSAAGRRFGDFRAELNAAIAQGYLQTQAYVTIGQVRQISVNVVGEVANPGVYALSGLSTVLDALNVAGGIRKAGSLRRIALVRGNESTNIDLYRFLSPDGGTPKVTLRQGDRIVVAPLGATVAVSGDVRRPGIYELPEGTHGLSVRAALSLANGYQIRGAYRLAIMRTKANGEQQFEDTTGHTGASLQDGEILVVNSSANYTAGSITLSGNVRLPGIYALNRARNLRDLLPDQHAFLQNTYLPFAFIVRQDKNTLTSVVIPFSVLQLLQGKYDIALQSDDVIHILTPNAMRELIALQPNVQPGVQPGLLPSAQTGLQQNVQTGSQSGLQPGLQSQSALGQQAGAQNLLSGQNAASCQVFRQGLRQVQVCTPAMPNYVEPEQLAPQLFGAPQSSGGMPGVTTGTIGLPGLMGRAGAGTAQAPTGSFNETAAAQGQFGQGTESESGLANGSQTGAESAGGQAVEGLTAEETATIGFMVKDYHVSLEGALRQPGEYLAAPGATLDEVVRAADGLEPNANLDAIEITSTAIDNVGGQSTSTRKLLSLTPQTLASVELHRLDVVHIPPVTTDLETGNVIVSGEVQFPGTFHILKGEHLLSLLTRAGGLTKDAFPLGAVFQRASVANVQQLAHQREADDLQKQLMATVARAGNALAASSGVANAGLSPEAAGFVADVIAQLRSKPSDGRMSVIADPAVLAARPEADIELQPGDQLFIPKRPSEIDVTGEVLNPGSFRYSPRWDVSDYIGMSGGYDRYADDGHIFVVNPDGTSRLVSDDLFDFQSDKLAPGSVIVVPRDLAPLDLGVLTVSISKVLSDMAISAASLAVLAKSN